jgi:hypothetical protein
MPRPKFRIACCLCGKPIPAASDVYALDREWRRRYPNMTGTLACAKCALRNYSWQCRERHGSYVAGHIAALDETGTPQPPDRDFDSWSHVGPAGTHVAMVVANPWSGMLQGAQEYLRYSLRRPGIDLDLARRLQAVLEEWDAAQAAE